MVIHPILSNTMSKIIHRVVLHNVIQYVRPYLHLGLRPTGVGQHVGRHPPDLLHIPFNNSFVMQNLIAEYLSWYWIC